MAPSFCTRAIAYGQLSGSSDAFLLTEFVDVSIAKRTKAHVHSFAKKLATVHISSRAKGGPHSRGYGFGFPVTTFAGPIQQDNTWKSTWADFYANNRLRYIANKVAIVYDGEEVLCEKVREVAEHIVPLLLREGHLGGVEGVQPSLVHGDLWSGNKARGTINDVDGLQDYAFDASCSYAHSEYDLSLMRMFGGFSAGFFSEYHRLAPKSQPVDEYEDRMTLYQL